VSFSETDYTTTKFNAGDEVEVAVAGEWRKGKVMNTVDNVEYNFLGAGVPVKLDGDSYMHIFWDCSVRRVKPSVSKEKDIVLRAIAWAHCHESDYKNCTAVGVWLEQMPNNDEEVDDLYRAMAYGLEQGHEL
jgi:hypothetical protein